MSVFIKNPYNGKSTAAFQVRVDSNIERAEALLRGIPGGAEKALDKAILSVRRQHARYAEKALLQEYNVTSAMLRKKDGKHARITPSYRKAASAAGHGVVHEVLYSTHRIPLAEFVRNPQDRRSGPARPIWKTTWLGHPAGLYHFKASISPAAHVKKESKAETIKRSFIARVRAGKDGFHTGVFERVEEKASMIEVNTGSGTARVIDGDSKIKQKYGLSVSEMLATSEKARNYIDENMNRSLDALMDEKIRAILDGRISV